MAELFYCVTFFCRKVNAADFFYLNGMLQKTLCIFMVVCLSLNTSAQDRSKLAALVDSVQAAYDRNNDSLLEYYSTKAFPLAVKADDINAEIKVQRLYGSRLFL